MPTNPRAAAGTAAQLTATAIYSDNAHRDVTAEVSWTTSNAMIATIGADSGKVVAIMPGTAILTATLHGQVATTRLTVTSANLVSIAISPAASSIAVGTTESLSATGTFSDNTTQDLTADVSWTSYKLTVARVNNGGIVDALDSGTTVISAICSLACGTYSLSGSATVTVTPAALVSIAITPSAASIALGTSEQFTATGTYSDHSTQNITSQVTWLSDTPSVATLSNAAGSAGLATLIVAGTTSISATSSGVASAAIKLTVTTATLVSIAVTPSAPSTALGTNEQFTATGTYSDHSTQNITTQVTWLSGTPSVATLSNAAESAGLAHPSAAGTTSVFAVFGSVASSAVSLTITPATLVALAISPGGPSIPVAGAEQFIATGTYSDNSTHILSSAVTWVSSDVSVAAISNAVNSAGLAIGLGVGSTSVSAVLDGIMTAPITLTVTAQREFVLHSFGSGSDGVAPFAGLIQGAGGNFYGTTEFGGANGAGTVYKVTSDGIESILWSFGSGTDGTDSYAGLIQGVDGNFYGTTFQGGANGAGTVYRVTPNGIESVLWSFGSGTDGACPYAGLILGLDGNFYGTTFQGGVNGAGVVYRVSQDGIESVLWSFGAGNDGALPAGALIQGADGNFYGTTYAGGSIGYGTVFDITPAGLESVLWSLGSGTDGQTPVGGLIQGVDGNIYGTTYAGGLNGEGTVFELTPAGVESLLWSFGNGADGQNPTRGLIQAVDGNFYGTTFQGGANGSGAIFELTPGGVETVLWSFGSGADGANPYGGLIQGVDGNFYGTTLSGGANGVGTVFKF